MLNNEEFTKRLENLFTFFELTPSSFADKIGVQRSSVSHLLSGRNKPSLDFVLKIQEAFPEIELNWLLYGKGNITATAPQAPTLFETEQSSMPLAESKKTNSFITNHTETATTTEAEANSAQPHAAPLYEKASRLESEEIAYTEIDKIVIFYKNGTFKSFKPN